MHLPLVLKKKRSLEPDFLSDKTCFLFPWYYVNLMKVIQYLIFFRKNIFLTGFVDE